MKKRSKIDKFIDWVGVVWFWICFIGVLICFCGCFINMSQEWDKPGSGFLKSKDDFGPIINKDNNRIRRSP